MTEDDVTAPARQGEWWYGHRTEKGSQYPIYQRWRESPEGPPMVLIDQNELAGESEFCALGHLHLDESQNRLAYSVDFTGDETFEIRFLVLDPRNELADSIEGASYGGAWSLDGEYFYYMDRGVVYAIAHVRGGGEMGRLWHLNGRMENKANTFTDFIAAGEHLIAERIGHRGRLAARGISAGGLLVGAVAVMRPELWVAILAEVPLLT